MPVAILFRWPKTLSWARRPGSVRLRDAPSRHSGSHMPGVVELPIHPAARDQTFIAITVKLLGPYGLFGDLSAGDLREKGGEWPM